MPSKNPLKRKYLQGLAVAIPLYTIKSISNEKNGNTLGFHDECEYLRTSGDTAYNAAAIIPARQSKNVLPT
jgi:hypothetical protein